MPVAPAQLQALDQQARKARALKAHRRRVASYGRPARRRAGKLRGLRERRVKRPAREAV